MGWRAAPHPRENLERGGARVGRLNYFLLSTDVKTPRASTVIEMVSVVGVYVRVGRNKYVFAGIMYVFFIYVVGRCVLIL